MTTYIQAETRIKLKPSRLQNLRQSGRLPGIVFGKNTENEMIHIPSVPFQKWLNQGASGFIELQFEEKPSLTVLLEDLQRDPVTRDLIHVDFQQVQNDEVLRTKIPVKFNGTPEDAKYGGVVQIQLAAIEVEALPRHLPTVVEFDISAMKIGQTLHVEDAEFAPEVTVISEGNESLLSVIKP
ncbi:50S ribosomal protein L25 [Paenibacillus xylanexedens]|uniref:50S ribosomal protein L25 n=1 Tax=Paenibacillus xylanexedens TaxID=528191 RepID=UPI0011A7E3B5|nr:50S ribosomal protein L25 [Paenibacillus xylanexedens]